MASDIAVSSLAVQHTGQRQTKSAALSAKTVSASHLSGLKSLPTAFHAGVNISLERSVGIQ